MYVYIYIYICNHILKNGVIRVAPIYFWYWYRVTSAHCRCQHLYQIYQCFYFWCWEQPWRTSGSSDLHHCCFLDYRRDLYYCLWICWYFPPWKMGKNKNKWHTTICDPYFLGTWKVPLLKQPWFIPNFVVLVDPFAFKKCSVDGFRSFFWGFNILLIGLSLEMFCLCWLILMLYHVILIWCLYDVYWSCHWFLDICLLFVFLCFWIFTKCL